MRHPPHAGAGAGRDAGLGLGSAAPRAHAIERDLKELGLLSPAERGLGHGRSRGGREGRPQ